MSWVEEREREAKRGVWGEDDISAVLGRECGSPVSLTQLQWSLRVGETEEPIGSIKIKTKQKQKTTKTNHVSTDSLLCKVIPMSPALRS